MKPRPETLGAELQLVSLDDINHALEEMAWLTSFQESIEAPAKVKVEALKTQTQNRLVVEIDGKPQTVKQRWEALKAAVLEWCPDNLKDYLPKGKKSLKLSHGELKTRKNEAAVRVLNDQPEDEVALEIARSGELIKAIDELLEHELVLHGKSSGIRLRNLIAVQFVLAKDPIKQEWARRPEVRELLQTLSISVEEQEQFTVSPARVQLATVDE